MNYTLSYEFNQHLNCGAILFNTEFVLMDFQDLFAIINFNKQFIYYNPTEKPYPYYLRHNQKISYLEFMFKYDSSNIVYTFKNGNMYDLRRCNIEIHHKYHAEITAKYNVIDYKLGHYSEMGKDAYVMKNPMWKVIENDKPIWLMLCHQDNILCKLCDTSYEKIIDYETHKNHGKKITFFLVTNGYVCSTNNLYIHQIITGCYGNGKGTLNISVDHIDQNPLNNTYDNLRIATREEQEQNSKGIKEGTKRARKTSATELPEGITHEMMPKYVYYAKEYRNAEKTIFRDFFRIEKHPNLLTKCWATSKSNSVSIKDKLKQAIDKLNELNKIE